MVKYLISVLILALLPFNGLAGIVNLQQGDRCSAVLSLLKGQETLFNGIVAESYSSNPENFDSLLKFIGDCPETYKISGYSVLIKAMKEENKLWSRLGLKLAFAVSRFDVNSSLAVEFPVLAQQLYFSPSPNCLLKNVAFNEYYYAADSWYGYDKTRRNNFCWTKQTSSAQSVYDVRVVKDDVFTLRNTYYDEFLFADEAQFSHSTERRRVFTFRQKPIRPVGSEWKFEPLEDEHTVKIVNVKYEEMLYADGDVHYDSSRREVFTERVKGHALENWTTWSLEC